MDIIQNKNYEFIVIDNVFDTIFETNVDRHQVLEKDKKFTFEYNGNTYSLELINNNSVVCAFIHKLYYDTIFHCHVLTSDSKVLEKRF
jgi:hypothetical protein